MFLLLLLSSSSYYYNIKKVSKVSKIHISRQSATYLPSFLHTSPILLFKTLPIHTNPSLSLLPFIFSFLFWSLCTQYPFSLSLSFPLVLFLFPIGVGGKRRENVPYGDTNQDSRWSRRRKLSITQAREEEEEEEEGKKERKDVERSCSALYFFVLSSILLSLYSVTAVKRVARLAIWCQAVLLTVSQKVLLLFLPSHFSVIFV